MSTAIQYHWQSYTKHINNFLKNTSKIKSKNVALAIPLTIKTSCMDDNDTKQVHKVGMMAQAHCKVGHSLFF